ncbi:MAG: Uma2 family endonuclease [Aquificae bacterium]|nr:Uma2 family endonuclease [Aquificota bacterium]
MAVKAQEKSFVYEENIKKKFTVDELLKMSEIGLFDFHDHVELIDGVIYIPEGKKEKMSPIGIKHRNVVRKLVYIFNQIIDLNKYFVDSQNRFSPDEETYIEPDIAIYDVDQLSVEKDNPEKVYLIVEVSHSTLSYDRNIKLKKYAQLGIKQVWIVNLQKEEVEIFENPFEEGYKDIHIKTKEDEIQFFQNKIKVKEIF